MVAPIQLDASDLQQNVAAEEAKNVCPFSPKNIPLVVSVILRILDNNRVVSETLLGTVKNGIKRDV